MSLSLRISRSRSRVAAVFLPIFALPLLLSHVSIVLSTFRDRFVVSSRNFLRRSSCIGVAFLDVVGVDWLEFAADFTAACFFVVLGMAPPFAFLPAVLSFSIFAIATSSFGISIVALGRSASSIRASSLEVSSPDWFVVLPLDSCCVGFFSFSSPECLHMRTFTVSLRVLGSVGVRRLSS